MLTLENIKAAQENCSSIVFHTPLLDHSSYFDFTLYNKLENLQKTGSFKIRGAFNKISQLSTVEKSNGIICASAGNHAQGVAFVANYLGIKAKIIMPKNAPLAKIDATRHFGGEIILYGNNFDEAYQYAKSQQLLDNSTFIEPYNDYQVITGQATIALEIFEKIANFDYIFVPVGGGGLISGIAYTCKKINPKIKVIGVQANNASSMYESLRHHRIISTKSSDTFADGIAVKKVGEITYDLCEKYVDRIVLVNEDEINQAVLFGLEKLHLMIEGAGAVGLAALLNKKIPLKSTDKVINIVSGGNIDITLASTLIESGLRHDSRRITFGTVIADKPGSLNKLLELLADKQANINSVIHDRYHHNTSAKTCYVEITIDTYDENHLAAIFEMLHNNGFDFRTK